jgi:hypothetical protein
MAFAMYFDIYTLYLDTYSKNNHLEKLKHLLFYFF